MFKQRIPAYQARVDEKLQHYLPVADSIPSNLHTAMRYASIGAGKRMRPLLSYAAAETLQLPIEQIDAAAIAIEMVHNYSLIHDDLPAMDDDDLRRGRPTCHKQFDEATAILAGDALLTQAFEILTTDAALQQNPQVQIAIIRRLAHASGSLGMAGGQAIDLAAQGKQLDRAQLEGMHQKKTGALIQCSVMIAHDLADIAPTGAASALSEYAQRIGLAFQVHDDILDVTGDTATIGKQQGADAALGKPTYPSILGLEAAQTLAQELREGAIHALAPLGTAANPLRELADYIVDRDH